MDIQGVNGANNPILQSQRPDPPPAKEKAPPPGPPPENNPPPSDRGNQVDVSA